MVNTKETTTSKEEEMELPLHETVFLKDPKRLEKLIESKKYDINTKDKFGKCF